MSEQITIKHQRKLRSGILEYQPGSFGPICDRLMEAAAKDVEAKAEGRTFVYIEIALSIVPAYEPDVLIADLVLTIKILDS